MSKVVRGTEGYAEAAERLVAQWQENDFNQKYRPVLHLFPSQPSSILDVGSGIGSDAAQFVSYGHSVVAVEPVDELRDAGIKLHDTPNITWVKDSLPNLSVITSKNSTFDFINVMGVLMHLDAEERHHALSVMFKLLSESGKIVLAIRHGEAPTSRRIFDVDIQEIVELAEKNLLKCISNIKAQSIQEWNITNGVTWTWLAFEKM
ncbi:MAG: class I SAM-dependent methyltransferase [Candidatus Paceibacterota bacterium]